MATAIVRLTERMQVLSNAPLNGGRCLTDTLFVMQVPHDYEGDYMADLEAKRAQYGLPHDSVGFMTAAEVKYVFSTDEEPCGEESVFVAATAGVTNCVVAGEPLDDWEGRKARSMEIYERLVSRGAEPSDEPPAAGTINIIAVSPEPLTNGGKVNLMIPIVEAKTLAMSDLGYEETGTTSDAMAVVSPLGDGRTGFAGTGTDVGMAVARAVRKAVGECLVNRGERPAPKSAAAMLTDVGATPEMFWKCAESLGLDEEVKEEFGETLQEMCDDPDVCALVYGLMSAGREADKKVIKNQEEETPGVLVDGTMAMLIASRISEERGSDSAIDLVGMRPLKGGPLPEYAEQAVYGLSAGVVAYMTGYSDE